MPRLPDSLKPFVAPLLLGAFFAAAFALRIHREMIDFDVYRRAGARVARAENLYRESDGHYQFKYLPAFALPMRPLAAIPEPVAKAAWYALSCALLVILLRWSVRALPERNVKERTLIWLAVLLTIKFYARELTLGQTNLLLAVMLVGAMMAAQLEARRTAGLLVGLGVFVKVYAAILIPWLFLAAGATGVGVAAAAIAIGLLLPALVYGWQGNLDQIAGWYRTVTQTTNEPNLLNAENVSAASAWTKWTGFGPHVNWLALVTIAAALVLPAIAFSRRRHVSDPLYLEFGLLMLLVPIVSPQGWDYVLLLAMPAFICLLDRWPLVSRGWQIATGGAFAFLSFTVYDLIGRSTYLALMNTSVMTIAVLTLAVCLVHLRVRKLA
jgi:hypothetical protein